MGSTRCIIPHQFVEMKLMVVPDIHGRHEKLTTAFERFHEKGYDKVILLGDLADSWDRTNEDILRCFKIASDMKALLGDKMEWLIGNHELHYIFADEQCSGFRPDLAMTLNPWLNENFNIFKVAHQEGNYLFSHAGVQKHWYNKYKDEIEATPGDNLAEKLNNMLHKSSTKKMVTECGMMRGGWRGNYGGPMWCDRVEMESYGPIQGYHQFVGHTPQKFVDKVIRFEGGKQYNNTSVTFCDVIDKVEKFWTKVEL